MKEERETNNEKILGIQQTDSTEKANCGFVTNRLFVSLSVSSHTWLVATQMKMSKSNQSAPSFFLFRQ